MKFQALLMGVAFLSSSLADKGCFSVKRSTPTQYIGKLRLTSGVPTDKFMAVVTFDTDFESADIPDGKDVECEGETCVFLNKDGFKLEPGKVQELDFTVNLEDGLGVIPEVMSIRINGKEICPTGEEDAVPAVEDEIGEFEDL